MQQYFNQLAATATAALRQREVFTAFVSGEDSDFCRFNGAKVRQAGSVKQSKLELRLIDGRRNAQGELSLSGVRGEDEQRVLHMLGLLREQLKQLPEDPYLLYATEVHSSERRQISDFPDSAEVVSRIVAQAKGVDLVGIYASGSLYRGFANSLGQRNWFETANFNFDFSLYLRADKAVKTGYAGFAWDESEFAAKLATAKAQLAVLDQPVRSIAPGQYRVYLAPQALAEVAEMLSWGGFSLKAQKTKHTPLLKMIEGGVRMAPGVTMIEDTAGGSAADFNDLGYTKPAQVKLIDAGVYRDALISPRSAQEYGVATNGAGSDESPQSLSLAAGSLSDEQILPTLGNGIYLNNLWYLNFSDRPAGRVTGMTRFASFWVDHGEIKQPLNVMRFDESILRLFGDKLVGLTSKRELLPSSRTYGQRSLEGVHLPGAVIDDFSLTL